MFYRIYDPKNWYSATASGSIELLSSYVDGIEQAANQSVTDYQEQQKVVPINVGQEDETKVSIHQGIDSQTWDMDSVFLEYFPSLSRRSGVVTLYSFFETELNKLCLQCKGQSTSTINITDLAGKGIKRASNYLVKVVGLDLQKGSSDVWQEIMHIQELRNNLVHSNGTSGDINESLNKYLNDNPLIDVKDEIILQDGYLRHVLNSFHDFYELIDSEIQKLEVPESDG